MDAEEFLISPEIARTAEVIAARRQSKKEPYRSTRVLGPYRSSREVHYIGVLGELAVGRYLGLQVDDSERVDGDSGSDFVVHGLMLDVQTSTHRDPHLKYDSKHPFRADIAILARYARFSSLIVLEGWIRKSTFRERSHKENYGHGVRDIVTVNDLEKMPLLRTLLGELAPGLCDRRKNGTPT